jgi:hypothetical protein
MADIFLFLLIGHFVFDWLLQTDRQAIFKSKSRSVLLEHCVLYSAGMCMFVAIGTRMLGIKSPDELLVVLFLFVTHILLDDYSFHSWWKRKIKLMPPDRDKDTLWLTICIDQIWHIIVLFICALRLKGMI